MSRGDVDMALNALARAPEPLDLASAVSYTRLLIADQWPAIQLIASMLLVAKELSYEQVLELTPRA